MRFLPRNKKVYIHTCMFGEPKLIAGRVICSMKHGHDTLAFIRTSLGVMVVKCKVYSQGTVKTYVWSVKERNEYDCKVFSSVEDFRNGSETAWPYDDSVRRDFIGFTSNNIDRYICYYIDGTKVDDVFAEVGYFLYDEENNRLVPGFDYLNKIKTIDDEQIEDALLTPMTVAGMLDMAHRQKGSSYRSFVFYRKLEEAKNALVSVTDIVEFDADPVDEKSKQPTLKDKLQEFVDQQGTSLEMLKTIIDEMP